MKINKMLIAVLAMLAVVLSSCKDDDPTVGIDSGMPTPIDFVYDEMLSSNTSISVSWNAERAIAAGATSFTVQLIKSIDAVGDIYDNNTTKGGMSTTIDATDKENNLCAFNGLKAGRIYYVRIRANYPSSVFSEWILASAAGAPARIKVGKGIVPDSEGPDKALDFKVDEENISETSAIVRWSTTSFKDNAADKKNAYTLELFEDEALSKLKVKWAFPAGAKSWGGDSYSTSFIFTSLKPNTSYWTRVTDTSNDEVSEILKITTAESKFKELPATAAAGDIILYQDFHELIWGGDLLHNAAGYSATNRSAATTEMWVADGNDPLNKVPEAEFYLVDASTEMGLFNTIGKAVPYTSLKDWGQQSEEANSNKPGIICARPGMLKMGANSFRAAVVTPELKCLTQPATIELTFKTAAYDDNESVDIELLDGTTKAETYSWITAKNQFVVETVNAGAIGNNWTEHKVTISNVTSTSRISIGATKRGEGATQHRFYLDDISIKLVSYGELTAPDAPAKPELSATDKTITVNWEKVNRADGYSVEYKKTADADWTVAVAKTAETTYTIEGLVFETSYDVRVKAFAGESASEPSEVAQITTLAEIKKLDTPTEIAATPGLGWVWLKFAPVLNATDYEVYSGDTKVESTIMSKEGDATTVVCAYGLNLNAAFSLKVKAVADGIESSDLSAEVTGTTGNIKQLTRNVGPTHVSVNWDDVSGGTSASTRGFFVELSENQDMSNPIYSTYCADGQASTNGAFGASSWYGKKENANLAPPTSITFGQLKPSTTYYFRVKSVTGVTIDASKGATKLNSTNGNSEFSPVVTLTTEASHTAGANEILFQGFDNVTMQSDFINIAAGMTPYWSDKKLVSSQADCPNPWEGAWCAYPFANSHLMSTWGMAAAGNYIDGSATHNIPQIKTDGKPTNYKNYIGNAKSGSLEGWYFGDQVSPHQGYVKVGNSSYSDFYLATPALTSSKLTAAGTACSLSFKGCLLMTDGNTIDIEVYRAATKTFETVKTITLESGLNSGWTTTDYVAEYNWTTYSTDLTLYPGDNVAIVTKAKNRLAVDDILIVTK